MGTIAFRQNKANTENECNNGNEIALQDTLLQPEPKELIVTSNDADHGTTTPDPACPTYNDVVHSAIESGHADADPTPLADPSSSAALPGDEETRETWGKKVDFLLSVIGFAVDLANVWRFPYLCYSNGGGAFLIPYVMMLLIGGIPLFYMELALGQYNKKGAITCWGRICPLFAGVGYSVVLIAFFTDFFYNVIISWALYYFFASFTTTLPWTTCNNSWNTPDCFTGTWNKTDDLYNDSISTVATTAMTTTGFDWTTTADPNYTKVLRVSPAKEYYERKVMELHLVDGVSNLGHVKWDLALCLLAVYLICYFSIWKGISTSGKVVWFTALFPYVVLIILLINGLTLPGAGEGIKYYLRPQLDRLLKTKVWVDAATQVFFSLGPGFGVLLAFASYNKFHNNVYYDALATSIINCSTSFLAGFVIFSVLGYMAHKTGTDISKVATEGPGLVFIVYPEALATLPGATFWSLIFFMMLMTLGLDSSFGGSEAIVTALSDEFPIVKRHREIFIACLFSFYMLIGLSMCTQGGIYVVHLIEQYAVSYSILFAVLFETVSVSWCYGTRRFAEDIKEMIGFKPGRYWSICWKFIAPVFIIGILLFGIIMYEPLKYGDGPYIYPLWANILGLCMALTSILCMPVYAIIGIIRTPGTLPERLRKLIVPWRDTHKRNIVINDYRVNGSGRNPEVV